MRKMKWKGRLSLSLLGKERERTGPRVLKAALLMRKGIREDVLTAPTPCYLQPSLRKALQRGAGCSDFLALKSNLGVLPNLNG